jgi:FRG domain
MQGRLQFDVCNDNEIRGKSLSLEQGSVDEVSINARLVDDGHLNKWAGNWSSTDNFSGTFEMLRLNSQRLDDEKVEIASDWNVLSKWIFNQESEKHVFRGLGDSKFTLVSTAHRAGIFDTHNYLNVLIPRVKAELLKRHGIRIAIDQREGLAEFLALIRHHGFPTPIVDWTKSPWVALYFAISSAKNLISSGQTIEKCRVYALTHDGIDLSFDVAKTLLEPSVHGPMVEIPTPLTSRVAAQEGIFLLSPCINMLASRYDSLAETQNALVKAIDIRAQDFDQFLRRLDQMMINHASMMGTVDATLSYLQAKLIT